MSRLVKARTVDAQGRSSTAWTPESEIDAGAESAGITNSAPIGAVPVTADEDSNLGPSLITDDGTNVDITTPVEGRFRAGDVASVGNGVLLRVDDASSTLQLVAPLVKLTSGANGEVFVGDTEGSGAFIAVAPGDQYIDIDPQTGGTLHLGHSPTQIRVDVGSGSINLDTPVVGGQVFITAGGGVIQQAPTSTPAASLGNAQIAFYLDEAGNKLKVAVKYSNGTAKTGEIALT